MKTFIIYKFTNKITSKIYIGKTNNIKRRIKEHKNSVSSNSSYYFHNALREYGFDNFHFEVIFESNKNLITEKEFCNLFEPHFIQEYGSHYSVWGYNMTRGGDGFDYEISKSIQDNLVLTGKHNFQIRNDGTSLSSDRVKEGTHNFLTRPDGTNQNTDRVNAGTHHFLKECGGSEKASLNNKRRIENGSHLFKNSEFQSKISRETKEKKNSRNSVILLRLYSKKFNIKLGQGWYLKSDSWIEEQLNFYIKKFGVLDNIKTD